MKLEVPFYLQTADLNCGPAALRMVLAYFDKDYGLPILEEKARIKEGKGVFTLQIAIAAASLGYKTELFSKQIGFNKENLELDFYKKYADLIVRQEDLLKEAKDLGAHIEEKTLSLGEILSKTRSDCIPIVLLDWSIIKGEKDKGYQGHFVPIVGYDKDKVYVHNHGMKNPKEFLEIPKNLFDTARVAKGTDEDIVFVYKKS